MSTPPSPGVSPEDRRKSVRGDEEKALSLRHVSRHNRRRVFEECVIMDGPTAKDIADITGLSLSTVTGALKQLEDSKLIRREDSDGPKTRGRRPHPIRVNDQKFYVAGVEIEPHRVHGMVTNLHGTVVTEHEMPLPDTAPDKPVDQDSVVDTVRELVCRLIDRLTAEQDDAPRDRPLLGLGVEIGGLVDGATGTVKNSPNMRWGGEWTDPVPLRQRLRDATRLHTAVDNDVNVVGIALRWFGTGRALENFAVVFMSEDGIGGARFEQGELVRGASAAAMEIGHLTAKPNGPLCRCGNSGCVEAMATVKAIGETLKMPPEQALRLAAEGDHRAHDAVADAGRAMGWMVANLCLTIDPRTIVFTGDQIKKTLAGDGRPVLVSDEYDAAMRQVVRDHPMCSEETVDFFAFEPDGSHWNGPRGAATLVIRDVITGMVQV